MKMELLYQLKFEYTYILPPIFFSKDTHLSSQHYFELTGEVSGKINGKFRGVNHPVKRSDDVFLSNTQAVIETDDAAFIYLDLKGYGVVPNQHADLYRSYMGPIKHVSDHEKYRSLNKIWCFGEGEVGATVDKKVTHTSGTTVINVYALHWEPLQK
ncbi:MAG: hypothetical protein A3E85_00975 [Gammaproteobacteria bacterium RIFCSPHIGHO2_12_FULL_45_12]|nr:MAG: hypothetical protein A3E85_00975 [Gammaproteobacteria bacterium RIFCSPHIGHO2_12_FULL_45_12]